MRMILLTTLLFIGCGNSKGTRNYNHLQKVNKGMRIEAVYEIMGPPDEIIVPPKSIFPGRDDSLDYELSTIRQGILARDTLVLVPITLSAFEERERI